MTKCVHSATWDFQTLADDPKDVDINIPIHQGSAVPRGKNKTCFAIAKMLFQHLNGRSVYVHVSVTGIGLGCNFKMTPGATTDVNDSVFQI
jgi:hypothetical protein